MWKYVSTTRSHQWASPFIFWCHNISAKLRQKLSLSICEYPNTYIKKWRYSFHTSFLLCFEKNHSTQKFLNGMKNRIIQKIIILINYRSPEGFIFAIHNSYIHTYDMNYLVRRIEFRSIIDKILRAIVYQVIWGWAHYVEKWIIIDNFPEKAIRNDLVLDISLRKSVPYSSPVRSARNNEKSLDANESHQETLVKILAVDYDEIDQELLHRQSDEKAFS